MAGNFTGGSVSANPNNSPNTNSNNSSNNSSINNYFNSYQFGEKEMLSDALSSQKFTTDGYNTFANECSNPAVKGEIMNILNEEHQIQFEIFSEMHKRGWYPVQQAEQQKIVQTKQKYQNS